jgi:hypothetical protein
MCDILFDRSILQLSNGIRHVMPSTDRMLELTAKHRWLSCLTAGCVFQWVYIHTSGILPPQTLRTGNTRWVIQMC